MCLCFKTAVPLEAAVLYLAKCGLDLQNKIYNEIISNCTIDKNIDHYNILEKRRELHTLNAFVNEVLRLFSDPTSLQYYISNATRINDFNIPKQCNLFVNLNAINKSEYYWNNNDAMAFNYKRYLDKNNEFRKNAVMVAFGVGRRSCPGETFVMYHILFIIGTLVVHYKFQIPHHLLPQDYVSSKSDFTKPNAQKLGVTVFKRQQ